MGWNPREGEESSKCGWELCSVTWSIAAPTWEVLDLDSSPNSTPVELGPSAAFHWVSFSLLVKLGVEL